VVYFFGGMLSAQREARWYGSRCLGLAAGFACTLSVWMLPDFNQVLFALVIGGGLVALAAWGSFLSGGVYAAQPRLARIALAATFLLGLSALSFQGKFMLGAWLSAHSDYWYELDPQGRVLLFHKEKGSLLSVTDLDGQVPPELEGKRLDRAEIQEIAMPWARGDMAETNSYRNQNRLIIECDNHTRPGNEKWWYVPDQGRLLGYDKLSCQRIGSIGPEGFARPDEQPGDRFHGDLAHSSRFFYSKAGPYLAFPGGVYSVNFRTLTVQKLFTPSGKESVRWASRWEDENQKAALIFVGTTDRICVLDEKGSPLVAAPHARGLENLRFHRVTRVGQLDNPRRYWVWYAPAWFLDVATLEKMPAYLVTLDSAGREISRQAVPPRPGGVRNVQPQLPLAEPSRELPLFGAFTAPVEAGALVGITRGLEAAVREENGQEIPLLLQFLYCTTQYIIPGVRWDLGARAGLAMGYGVLMLLVAVFSGLVCFQLGRRYAFSGLRCLGWGLVGVAFGWTGLVLMLALQEWPARIACPKCRKPRIVTRDTCEHCGAPHALPAPDGTEIFEQAAALAEL
jgi:hypothetical protein